MPKFLGIANLLSAPVEVTIRMFFSKSVRDEYGRKTGRFYIPKLYNPWGGIGRILLIFCKLITALILLFVSMAIFVPSTFEYAFTTLGSSLSSGFSLSGSASLNNFSGYGISLLLFLKDAVLSLGQNAVWKILLFALMVFFAALTSGYGSGVNFPRDFKRLVYLPTVIVVSFAANFLFALINFDVYTAVANYVNAFGVLTLIALSILVCAYIVLILLHVLVFLIILPFKKATKRR